MRAKVITAIDSSFARGGKRVAFVIALLLVAKTLVAAELGKWIYLPTEGEGIGVISNATGVQPTGC